MIFIILLLILSVVSSSSEYTTQSAGYAYAGISPTKNICIRELLLNGVPIGIIGFGTSSTITCPSNAPNAYSTCDQMEVSVVCAINQWGVAAYDVTLISMSGFSNYCSPDQGEQPDPNSFASNQECNITTSPTPRTPTRSPIVFFNTMVPTVHHSHDQNSDATTNKGGGLLWLLLLLIVVTTVL